ncbi:hypothetical protein [Trinickia soli]|nr:hypothetical protein [Trinickia soli]CAB3699501.1 hypothetical protein LMG24076_03350 [Trinickia soli]
MNSMRCRYAGKYGRGFVVLRQTGYGTRVDDTVDAKHAMGLAAAATLATP